MLINNSKKLLNLCNLESVRAMNVSPLCMQFVHGAKIMKIMVGLQSAFNLVDKLGEQSGTSVQRPAMCARIGPCS
eukprot:4451410-Amphidinium_carterae.1